MRTLILIVMSLSLTGCAALAAGLASVGAGFGVGHYVNGTNYRTFTEPLPKVRIATLTAFQRMAIKVDSTEKTKAGEVLTATTNDRRIEVELEAITPNATRMRSVAKHRGQHSAGSGHRARDRAADREGTEPLGRCRRPPGTVQPAAPFTPTAAHRGRTRGIGHDFANANVETAVSPGRARSRAQRNLRRLSSYRAMN